MEWLHLRPAAPVALAVVAYALSSRTIESRQI